MRRNTSPAAAPTPTRPAPSHTMASGTSGSGPVDETALPGPTGAPAACGARVGWDWRALMDNAVGKAGPGVASASLVPAPFVPSPAAPSCPAAAPTAPKRPGTAGLCAPTAPDTADGAPAAGSTGPGITPVPAPRAGAGDWAGTPPAFELPAAGAAPGAEGVPAAGAAPEAEGDPGWAVAGADPAPVGAAGAVVCVPGARGVPDAVGDWEGAVLADAEPVIPGSKVSGREMEGDGVRGARVSGSLAGASPCLPTAPFPSPRSASCRPGAP